MKIASVHATILRAELDEPFGWSQFWARSRSTTLVQLRTDDGLEGLGECFGPPESAKTIIEVQEHVRAQAEAFVASEVRPGDLINVTESTMALPLTNWNLFSVTVWYREAQ